MDPYLVRFAFFWYNDAEIFHDSEEDIERKIKLYADQGITHLITFSCTHFRWSFQPYWGLLNECLAKIVRAAHKYGLKVVEHHSSELTHQADTPEQVEFLRNLLKFRKSSLESWPELLPYLRDKNSDANKWVQINEKTGQSNINRYQGVGKCYNNPEYREKYLKYLESVYATGVDGIMTDDVQYYCYCTCEYCRKGFKEKYGHTLPPPEKWDEWMNTPQNREFADLLRFRHDSTRSFHVMVKEHYDKLGLKLLRPNYHSFAFSPDTQSCGIDRLPEMHWYFQECALSCLIRFSFLKSACEQKHRVMIAKEKNIPHGILNYAYTRDELVFSWGVAMLSGSFYTNTPEGGNMVDESVIRSFEKKYASSLFHCEALSPVGFLHSFENRSYSPGYIMSRMEAWVQMCILRNTPCAMVNTEHPEHWKRCPIICVNEIHMLSDEDIANLKNYVKDGGNLVITGQSGIQDKDNHIRTKEEMDAVWGISFEARHASKPEITPYGKGKFCIVPDSFAYPLDEKDIASMFKADCAKYNFNSEQLPYLLTRHAPFVIVAPDPPGLQRESNITELYHGLMDRSPELMELFNTLSPAVFSTELPEGIIASPCCSRQEKSITIRLLNTTDALIVNNKDNIISRKDTVVWKKWQGGDGRITITMAKDEKIAEAIYSDLSLQERSLICELKDKERNTWEIILPAGLLEDFGYITLSLA